MKSTWFGVVVSAFLCLDMVGGKPPAMPLPAQTAELEVKAAFLFNFAKFIDWPPDTFTQRDSPFTICLAGDPFGGVIDNVVDGETLDGRRLTVRRLARNDDVHGCQIVYVAAGEGQRAAEIVRAAGNAPILTVADTTGFINDGGMIRFVRVSDKIHFEINPDAAKRVSLKVSSRLLRLADIVHPEQRMRGVQ